jgi:hypothetical protein
MAMSGDEDPFGINYWNFMAVNKDEITGIKKQEEAIPSLAVYQNYPNPFSTRTTIRFELAEAGPVTLEVMNVMGQVVYQSSPETKPAGSHAFVLERNDLSKGVYFFTLTAGKQKVTRKMILE